MWGHKVRILLLHNAYQRPGGEDAVLDAEARLLREAGHSVHVEVVSNDAITSLSDKVTTLLNTPYNPQSPNWVADLIEHTRAEIVHVHNFFPLISPSVHEAAAKRGVAVVQTLHNYRLICASATRFRNGNTCNKCVVGSKLWGAVHRCYRGSLTGSMAVVFMQMLAEYKGTWRQHVHRFICLSEAGRGSFIEAGLPADRLVVKPNFVWPPSDRAPVGSRNGALFVGRVVPEKGLQVLLAAMREVPELSLTVVGDGPGLADCKAVAPSNVSFEGRVDPDLVAEHMARARFLVVPSIWEEPFGLIVPEAMSMSLPVVASRIGALSELVTHRRDGMLFEAGNVADLVGALREMCASSDRTEQMGKHARNTYEERFSPASSLALLEEVYRQAMTAAVSGHVPASGSNRGF